MRLLNRISKSFLQPSFHFHWCCCVVSSFDSKYSLDLHPDLLDTQKTMVLDSKVNTLEITNTHHEASILEQTLKNWETLRSNIILYTSDSDDMGQRGANISRRLGRNWKEWDFLSNKGIPSLFPSFGRRKILCHLRFLKFFTSVKYVISCDIDREVEEEYLKETDQIWNKKRHERR